MECCGVGRQPTKLTAPDRGTSPHRVSKDIFGDVGERYAFSIERCNLLLSACRGYLRGLTLYYVNSSIS